MDSDKKPSEKNPAAFFVQQLIIFSVCYYFVVSNGRFYKLGRDDFEFYF